MSFFVLPAFIIAVRETMEAALIVSIILAYLTKTNNLHFRLTVWYGVITAVITSIVVAFVLNLFFQGLSDRNEKLMEGLMFVFTALLLSSMILLMFKQGKLMGSKIELKMNMALEKGQHRSVFLLVFFLVLREGIETVLFFIGAGVYDPKAAFFSGTLGIALTTIAASLIFTGTVKMDMRSFFNVTSIFLIFFAAGLLSHGFHEFQVLGWFGSETSLINTPFMDLSEVLNDKTSFIGVTLRMLFGYQDQPTLLELGVYVTYWVAIYTFMQNINRRSPVVSYATN